MSQESDFLFRVISQLCNPPYYLTPPLKVTYMLKLLRFIEAHLELYMNEPASTFKQLHVVNIEQVLREQIAKKSNHQLIRAKTLEIITQVYIL